jgi:hypothetical protein
MADIVRKVESTVIENSTNVSQTPTAVKKNKKSFLSWFSCFSFDVSEHLKVKEALDLAAKAVPVSASASVSVPPVQVLVQEALDLTPVVVSEVVDEIVAEVKKPSRVSKAFRQAKVIFRSHKNSE